MHFSFNSIPAYLLKKEAIETYRKYVREDGLMFFHTTNRSMDVSSVVIHVAREMGLDAKFISFSEFDDRQYSDVYSHSWGVMVVRKDILERATGGTPEWIVMQPSPLVKP